MFMSTAHFTHLSLVCTNPGHPVAVAAFCTVAPNICVSSILNFITLLVPRILKWLPDFS